MKEIEKYLSAKEVGELLSVKRGTLYGWAARGQIPAIKLSGRTVRFKLKDIQRFLEGKDREAQRRAFRF
jgi:excisionase family DNA binding protein